VPLTGFDNAGNSSQRNCSYKVNKAATTTTVKSSANPSVIGQSVQLTATVSVSSPGAGTPGGNVTFNDGMTTLGMGALSTSGGVTTASFTATSLGIGAHTINASYDGDTNFAGSTSSALSQLVRYGVQLEYKLPMSANSGSTVPIKIELVDAAGNNVSATTVGVEALCVVVKGATDCSGTPAISYGTDSPFSFMATLDTGAGYQFNVKSTGLAAGTTDQLLFRAAGEDSSSYHADANATFNLTK